MARPSRAPGRRGVRGGVPLAEPRSDGPNLRHPWILLLGSGPM